MVEKSMLPFYSFASWQWEQYRCKIGCSASTKALLAIDSPRTDPLIKKTQR